MQKYELKSLRQERDELQAQVAEYEQLDMMQLEAGARAAKLYNEKHGTDIGQFDLARGMVFLMEQNDELQAQVKEREREIEQIEVKCCACHAGHIAQVAVLRGSLETATDYLYNPFEPDNQCAQYKNIKNILQTTPAEAAERVQKLVEALEHVQKAHIESRFDHEDGITIEVFTRDIHIAVDEALAEWRRYKCS